MPSRHKYGNASSVTTHVDSYADGGEVHGTPMGLQKPSKRKRPKVGDKDPNYKPGRKRSSPTSSKPAAPKPPGKGGGSVFRDYRGSQGAIDDASGVKKKYADGGEVKKKVSPKKKPGKKKPPAKKDSKGIAAPAEKALSGRQAQLDQQMKDLGI